MTENPSRPISGLLQPVRSAVRTSRRLYATAKGRGRVHLRGDTVLGAQATIISPERFEVGYEVFIGREFHCEVNATIGDHVLISSRVSFVGNDHEFDDSSVPITQGRRLPPSTVVIEGDTLIGYGTTVVGDVTIARGCIVGAGSLVTRDLPADMVCVGRPAVPVRPRRRPEDDAVDGGSGSRT